VPPSDGEARFAGSVLMGERHQRASARALPNAVVNPRGCEGARKRDRVVPVGFNELFGGLHAAEERRNDPRRDRWCWRPHPARCPRERSVHNRRGQRADVSAVATQWQPRRPPTATLRVAPTCLSHSRAVFCEAKHEHGFERDRRRGAAKRRAPTSESIRTRSMDAAAHAATISERGWRHRPQLLDE
jgi:hypothetical protein